MPWVGRQGECTVKFTTKRFVLIAAMFATLTVSITGCYYHDRDRREGYYDRNGSYHYYDRDDYRYDRYGRRYDRDDWRDRNERYRYDRNDYWRNR
jgi:hypothetical protein